MSCKIDNYVGHFIKTFLLFTLVCALAEGAMSQILLPVQTAQIPEEDTGLVLSNENEASDMEAEADFGDNEELEGVHGNKAGSPHGNTATLKHFKDKFNIKLYLDFIYEQTQGAGEEPEASAKDPQNGSFNTNHTYLLVSAHPTDELRVGFDITFKDYYEIEYALTPGLFIKWGKIFPPFGDFKYHAIYGGKVPNQSNDLFPNWFTDNGIALEHRLFDTRYMALNYGFFISNGFQSDAQGNLNINAIGYNSDNNAQKAFGGRVKAELFGGYTATASGMMDRWSNDGSATLRMLAAEIASTRGLMKAPLLRNMNLKIGFLDHQIVNEKATDEVYREYNAWGSHLEISYRFGSTFKAAYRTGEIDPHEDIEDETDQKNQSIILIYSVNEYLEFWTMYQQNQEKYVDEIQNDYLMLKALVQF